MEKRRLIQNLTIIVLGVAIIVMSVGYANFDQKLEINGDATAVAAKWDIHYDDTSINYVSKPTNTGTMMDNSSTYTNTAKVTNSNHLITFDTLLKPGETFSFTVDVVNGGTFDAKLNSIAATGTTQVKDGNNASWTSGTSPISVANSADGTFYQNNYLTYSVVWDDGKAPLKDATNFTTGYDTLAAGAKKKLLVTVDYKMPADAADLPTVDTNYHFELDLNYLQA